MAKIEVTGFVQDWTRDNPNHPSWGMKLAETHSKMVDGERKTVARTYRTIKAAYGQDIDFQNFRSGDRVTVTGWEFTDKSERNGETYYTLTVNADSVTMAENSKKADPTDFGFTPVEDETPF